MNDKPAYIAAFDLDKTIISINSARLIVTTSRKLGIMRKRDFLRAIYFSIVYKFDLRDANKIVSDMTSWLKGLEESEIILLINEHIIPEVMQLVRPEIRERMDKHRKEKGRLVLLSSAMNYICKPIAKQLNMDDVIASELEVSDGIFTGNPIGNLNFGKQKAVSMKDYCDKHGYELKDAYYYGDAYTDRFVLNEVGHAVCVKPEIKLGRMARRKGWEIL